MPNEAAGLVTRCTETNKIHIYFLHSPIKSGRVCARLLDSAHFWHHQCRPSDLMGFLFLVENDNIHKIQSRCWVERNNAR